MPSGALAKAKDDTSALSMHWAVFRLRASAADLKASNVDPSAEALPSSETFESQV